MQKVEEIEKKSLIYRKNLKLDLVIVVVLFLILLESLLLPEDEFKSDFIAYSVIFYSILFFLTMTCAERRREYFTKRFDGKFDEFIKEMYVAGLELENKIGTKYIFVTRYVLLPKTRLVVEDCVKYCEVFGTKIELKHLSDSGIALSH